uniref:Uncharacterized protein n=1 Tax=Vombatus ursinus TaxID=29139 RepID=A0A4X2KJ79_VOMUR
MTLEGGGGRVPGEWTTSCFPNQNQTQNCWQNYLDFQHFIKFQNHRVGKIPEIMSALQE